MKASLRVRAAEVGLDVTLAMLPGAAESRARTRGDQLPLVLSSRDQIPPKILHAMTYNRYFSGPYEGRGSTYGVVKLPCGYLYMRCNNLTDKKSFFGAIR